MINGLYLILDSHRCAGRAPLDVAEAALEGGVRTMQLRNKHGSFKEVLKQAVALRRLCDRSGARLVVNDDPRLALEAGADGLHLGQTDGGLDAVRDTVGDAVFVGRSTHSLAQAVRAVEEGVDYVSFGALFQTTTKHNAVVVGIDELAKVRDSVTVALVAIGGITRATAPQVVTAGVDALAVGSDITADDDPRKAVESYTKLWL